MSPKRKAKTTPDNDKLNTVPDLPDIRDWPYKPTLASLRLSITPPTDLIILDSRSEVDTEMGFVFIARRALCSI